jgi:CRP-like cAMP-binding protein
MEESLLALLLADPALVALTGPRMAWLERRQGGALPALVLTLISGAEGLTQDGPDGLGQYRVQIDAYGATYGDAKRVSRAVIALLHGYSGPELPDIIHESSRDLPEAGTNEAQKLFRVSSDFIINQRSN